MKLVLTLLVRDEEDVIDANLRYHLARGVDFIIATDNKSEDGTRAVLEKYERRGVLRVIDEPADDYDQQKWVTRMARLAATDHAADWVINSDADEFWWSKRGDLKDALNLVPTHFGSVMVPRVNFIPGVDRAGPFYERMVLRETFSVNIHGDPLPPKVAHRSSADVVVLQGNHAVHGEGLAPLEGPCPLTILHFPMRSYAHFENKIVKGGQAYQRNTEVPWIVGSGWRLLYERYQQGTLRAWYDEFVLPDEVIDRRIGEGTLILDRRLAGTLTAGVVPHDHPAAPSRAVPSQRIAMRGLVVAPPSLPARPRRRVRRVLSRARRVWNNARPHSTRRPNDAR